MRPTKNTAHPHIYRYGKMLLALMLFALPELLFAQAKTVSGTVTDDNGQPAESVSVIIRSDKTGTKTDDKGNYSLTANTGATLVFSSVNFKTVEMKVGAASSYNVKMELSAASNSDVVVVGYTTQRKGNITGAVSVVGKEMIENRPVTNAIGALQGTAPGLVITRASGQPGNEGYNINIRGASSINGSSSALVIIDGVEGDMQLLNPSDIESVSVLKDASAAAIYGAKAAGGVVIVTTKKGRTGKPKLEYTGLATFNKFFRVPEPINSWEQAETENLANLNAGLSQPFSQQQIDWLKNGKDTVINAAGNLDYYFNTDVVGMALKKTTNNQNHNLTVSGGNENSQYLIGLGAYTQNGVLSLGPDSYKRYNARFNLNQKITKFISLDSRISYTNQATEAPNGNIAGDYGILYTFYVSRRRFPIYLPGSDDTKYASGSPYDAYRYVKDGGYFNTNSHNVNGVFTLKAADFIKGLSIRLVYSPNLTIYSGDVFSKPIALWNYNNATVPASYNPNGGNILKNRVLTYNNNVQALIDYNFKLGGKNNLYTLGGFEYKYFNSNQVQARTTGLISPDLASLNNFLPTSTYSGTSDNVQTNAWVSYFGTLKYNFDSKYFADVTIRDDASSRLAPGFRNQIFYSFSAGWAFDKEKWFEKILPAINQLKIRGSFGRLGNAIIGGNYDYVAQLARGDNYPFNNAINTSFYQGGLPSSGIGWETVQTSNIGADFALMKNRLTGSFDYFIKDNKDMAIAVSYPSILGVAPRTSNDAAMRTKGWEAALNWRDKVGDFTYNIGVNMGDNTNEITKYSGQTVVNEGINSRIEGYPLNSLFGFEDEGYFTSQDQINTNPNAIDPKKHAFINAKNAPGDIMYKDQNGDGKIDVGAGTKENHGDLVYLGNLNPRYQFGINLGASWKGIDIAIFGQGVAKMIQYLQPNTIIPKAAAWLQPFRAQMDYWTPENTDARFPRLYNYNTETINGNTNVFNGRVSTHWIQNAAYLRLKNLQVGYTLPTKITEKAKIQKARIFFTGQDLWETTGMWYPYFDPENLSYSPGNAQAGWSYPFFRSYAVGLNVTF